MATAIEAAAAAALLELLALLELELVLVLGAPVEGAVVAGMRDAAILGRAKYIRATGARGLSTREANVGGRISERADK